MTLHAVHPSAQMTLDLDLGLVERHPTLLDCLRAAVYASRRPLKAVAADCDMSASDLGRKLSGNPDDPRRFSVDDLERYVQGTGDTTPIEYLAAKYLQTDEARRAHALNQATRILAELAPLVAALKGQA
jgi:hypothetical protein